MLIFPLWDLRKRWTHSPGKNQSCLEKLLLFLLGPLCCLLSWSGVRCLPFPRPTFINVSSHLPNAKPKKHSPVLLQHEVLLSYLRLCFLKWCVLFFNISFSKLSSALSSFTRHSSESLAVSLKVPSLSPSQSHCPLCVPYRKQFHRCLLSALVFWLCVYHGKALFAVFATTISMRGTQRARLLALH